jgi:uncharacterized membrane protein YsdA (DUF1294 family)
LLILYQKKMIFNNQLIYVLSFFTVINLIAFLIMLVDKIKSTNPNAERISEGKLFFMAVVFGSLGVYAGMFAFRHKTRKWYFVIGIPFLIIQNIATAYLIYLYLVGQPAIVLGL